MALLGILILVLLGVSLRLLPHLPNFVPIAAISLFAGVYLNRKYFFLVPISAMLLSDYFIGFYELKVMASVYFSFFIISLTGLFLRKHKNPAAIISCSLAGSLLFYLITNFAVFAFTPWYPKDLAGLLMSYTLALPFFRNTILGDLFYTSLFFGIWELYPQRHLLSAFLKRKFIVALTS